MEIGDAVWTGSAHTARRNRQGHPGLERPQREGGGRDVKAETESVGSADEAGPAPLGGTGAGEGLGLRTVKAPPWETRLQWGFGGGAPTPE